DLAPPGPGEAQLRQTATGINLLDTHQRKGLVPLPLPTGLGFEASGMVEAIGPGVKSIKPGDRAAYYECRRRGLRRPPECPGGEAREASGPGGRRGRRDAPLQGPHRAVPAARNPRSAARRPVARVL